MDEAARDQLIPYNPVRLCQEPQAEEYKTAPLRLGQIQRYLNAAEQFGVLPLIYTGRSSGLRQCERITLSWADFPAGACIGGLCFPAVGGGPVLHGPADAVRGALSEGLHIDDLDLMSVLSNLLDNALAAAAQTGEKTVEAAMGGKGGAVVIQVRNSIGPDQMPDLFQTTKKNKQARRSRMIPGPPVLRFWETDIWWQ